MKKYILLLFVFIILSCSNNIKINRNSVSRIKKCAILTYFHTLWLTDFGPKYFPKMLSSITRVHDGYKGYPLIKDGLKYFMALAKNRLPKVQFFNTTNLESLENISLYQRPTRIGHFYFVNGNKKIILPISGTYSKKSFEKIKTFLKNNNFDAGLAIKYDIEIKFIHPIRTRLDRGEHVQRIDDTSIAFVLTLKLKARMIDQNGNDILNYNDIFRTSFADFIPSRGHTLFTKRFFTKFLNYIAS